MRRTLCFCVFISLSLAASMATRAIAQTSRPAPAGAEDREAKARELFALGKYEDALAIYGKLYAESPHPTYLRNIGRCYQNLRKPDEAISSFEEYLRQSQNLPAEQRSLVERYIRDMRELKAKQAAEAANPAPPPPARAAVASEPVPAAVPPAKVSEPVTTTVVDQPHPADTGSSSSNPKRVAGIVVGAVAVAALGVGAFFGVRAISKGSDVDAQCPGGACNSTGINLDHEARTAARVADITLGAGIAAGVVATYLLITSRESGSQPAVSVARRGMQLVPEAGPHGGAIGLRVRW
jgi:hypothetical protein